jgi:imidazolonepropionase-like amidohydrolase
VASSKGAYLDRPGTDTLNPFLLYMDRGTREFWSGQDPAEREVPRAAFYREATGQLHRAGVPLLAGSDAGIFTNIPGSALTRELELLVAAGLTPHEALTAATRTNADRLGFARSGRIDLGYRANLVLVEGDPLTDVSIVEHPDGVMVAGRWLDADRLGDLREGARQTSFLRSLRRGVALLISLR